MKNPQYIALGRLMEALSVESPATEAECARFIERMSVILPACHDLLEVLSDDPSNRELIEAITDFDSETEDADRI